MKLRWGIIVFIVLFVINMGVGVYLYGLGKKFNALKRELEIAKKETALQGPLLTEEKAQQQEIEKLVKYGSNGAVDRLVRYGKNSGRKSISFAAITSLKRINSPYAKKKLRQFFARGNKKFTKEMAVLAYQMYGCNEDVEELESLEREIQSRDIKDKLKTVAELLKQIRKEDVDRTSMYSFVEFKPQ